jgi:hypothetical protein
MSSMRSRVCNLRVALCVFGLWLSTSATPGVADRLSDLEIRAQAGDLRAQFELGNALLSGNGAGADYQGAARWYAQAAEGGLASAQFNLGVFYDRGLGVEVNQETASRWYLLAAEQGHLGSQHNLGMLYASGGGVARDTAKARRWFERAAESGLAHSQYNLGILLLAGEGGPEDVELARTWFKNAAKQGLEAAKAMIAKIDTSTLATRNEAPTESTLSASRADYLVSDQSGGVAQAPPIGSREASNPEVATPEPGNRVQLIALFSEQDVLGYWRDLSEANPELTRGLKPVVETLNTRRGNPVLYRLQVEGFASGTEARQFCTDLQSKDADAQCFPVATRGR